MSRNGSGVYSLPAGNPVVTGTTISSTWANNTLTNIASALTDSLAADGQTTATGNLKMGANRITGLADGVASTDAATVSQVTASTAGLGTMSTQNANNVTVTGGTINGTTVGATTAATGRFTTLNATGVATFAADSLFTSTGAVKVPVGTTAQQPTPVVGMVRYNSTLNQYEGYVNSAWVGLGGSAAGSNTQVQYNNSGVLAGSSALTFNGTTLATTTLQSTNLSDGTNSTLTADAIRGSAKAWINWNGVPTTSIRASYNISSLTRTAQGTYTIAFTNALTDANYAFAGMSIYNSATRLQVVSQDYRTANTASNCYVVTGYAGGDTSAGFLNDVETACIAFYR
jgi:hypothetical protein